MHSRFRLLAGLVLTVLWSATSGTFAAEEEWSIIPDPLEQGTDFYYELLATESHLYVIPRDAEAATFLFRRSHGAGSEWAHLPLSQNPIAVGVAGELDEHVVVSTLERRIWYSADGGTTWEDRTSTSSLGGLITKVLVHESGWTFGTVIWGEDNTYGVLRSSDFGETWEFSEWCSGCIMNPLRHLESNGDPQYLWVCYNNGFFEAEMQWSTDWGATWEMVEKIPLYDQVMRDVVIDPVYTQTSYMLGPRYLHVYDGAELVETIIPPFGSGNGSMSMAAPAWHGTVIYAMGLWSNGLFAVARSPSFGQENWETVREGIPDEYPPHPVNGPHKNHLEPHPSAPRMYLSAWTMGLWERDFALDPSAVPTPVGDEELATVRLQSAYPNPSSGQIDMSLWLGKGLKAEIQILDVAGRSQFESRLGLDRPGSYELGPTLSPILSELPAGTYFIRVSDEEWSEIRRVSVIR